MKHSLISGLSILICLAFSGLSHAEDVVWNCPDGEYARKAIISGEAKTWPYFSPGPGMRVQEQHPNTALSAQSKYLEGNGKSAAVCQYYNHIGYVATILAIGAKKHVPSEGSYWRKEYSESLPENDDPNNPMMDVCMTNEEDLAIMSIGCAFLIPVN